VTAPRLHSNRVVRASCACLLASALLWLGAGAGRAQIAPPLPAPPAESSPSAPPEAAPSAPEQPETSAQGAAAADMGPAPEPAPTLAPAEVPPRVVPSTEAAKKNTASGAVVDSGEEEEEEENPWAPWSAIFGWTQYYTAAGLSQRAYLTFDPTYSWNFFLAAGYNFSKQTSLSLTQLATVELTDSDTTAKRQQFLLYDTYLDASHKIPIKIDKKHGYVLSGLAGVLLPTSKASQAANMVLGARARLGAGYTTSTVLHGLDAAASVGYMRRFATSATLQAESRFPCNVAGTDGSQQCAFLGGLTSSRDITLLGIDGTLHMSDKWSAGVSMTFWWALGRGLTAYDVPVATSSMVAIDSSATHWRNSRWLLLFATYQFNEWLSATARVTDIFAERGPNGHLRAPFDPLDTLLGLELDISFDQLYLATRAHGK